MVRCGICSTGFNALENLSERPVPRPSGEDAQRDTITVEEVPGTEFIELSGAAAAGNEGPDAGSEDEGVPVGADALDDIPDTALEFHGTSDDLERLFIEAGPPRASVTPFDGAEASAAEGAIAGEAPVDLPGIGIRHEELPWPRGQRGDFEAGDPGRIAAALAVPSPAAGLPPAADGEAGAEAVSAEEEVDSLSWTDEYPVLVVDADEEEEHTDAAASGDDEAPPLLLIPDELRRGPSATAAEELASVPGLEEPAVGRRWPMAAAATLLGLALLAQAVHHWRTDLARDPVAGPWVLGAYRMLGLDLPTPVDLASFELRQLGAASEPSQAGRIKVRASIQNRAVFAQPFPVLRLTLQDRFGSTIGVRDLEPAEYLPGGRQAASGLLGPSERADAEVVFVDPGRDAVGFELDVCMPDAAGLRCSDDLPGVDR
jgi:hypothetical protein